MYRKGGYIVGRIFGLLAVLLMTAIVAIQMPFVQTRLSKIALNQVASILNGRIQYDELKVMTSGVLVIRNLSLVDSDPYTEDIYGRGWEAADTLFRAKSITATFAIDGLFKGEGLHLGRVTIEDGYMHLVTEPDGPGNNLTRILNLAPPGEPVEPAPNLFDIKKVRIKNFRFRLNSFLESKQTRISEAPHIDFEDLDVTVDITGHNLKMAGGVMSGVCDKLSAREKSGYILEDLSASCAVGQGVGLIEDIHIRDPWSDIRLRALKMTFDGPEAFSNFLEEVTLEGEFRKTQLAVTTLGFFAADLFPGARTALEIRRGHMLGTVSDFRVDRLEFIEKTSELSATIEGALSGLPDVEKLQLDVRVKDLVTSSESASRLISGLQPARPVDFSHIARGLPVTAQLHARGPIGQLDIDGTLSTAGGEARFDGSIEHLLEKDRHLLAELTLALQEMDLGQILGTDTIGPVTLRTRANAVLKNGLPDATLDTLRIERIRAFGHDFQQIQAAGSLQDGTLSAHLHSDDPDARLNLTALADLGERADGNRYRVNGSISDVSLAAFGINTDKVSRISTGVRAELVRNGEFLDGNAFLPGIRLSNPTGRYSLGDLNVDANTRDGRQFFILSAPFLEADFAGTHSVPGFIRDLLAVTAQRELSALVPRPADEVESGAYDVLLNFRNTRDILAALLPGAYIEENTSVAVSIREGGGIEGSVQSKRIALGKNYLKDVGISFDNSAGALALDLMSSELRAGTFAMSHPAISASADDNDFSVGVLYDSFSGAGGNAEIRLKGRLSRDEEDLLIIQARPVDSFLMAGDKLWSFGESDIVLHGSDLYLDHFQIANGPQRLLLDGALTSSGSDTLTLQMDRFDLALVDEFLPNAFGIEGKMDGRAYLSSDVGKTLGMLMDFSIDTLSLGGVSAGSISLSSTWKDEGRELALLLQDRLEGRNALDIQGSYFIRDKSLDLRAALDHLPLNVAAPFLKQVFTEMDGGISGTLSLRGPTDNLIPTSDLRLDDARFRVAATGVSYTLQGPLRVDERGCYFDTVQVADDDGGSGGITGALRFEHLRNFKLDARLALDKLKVLDAAPRLGQSYYGLARASGTAAVSGPFNALVVDANVSTVGNGDVHVPLSGKLASSSSDLLTFTEPKRELDAYETLMAELRTENGTASDIRIRGRVAIHPGLKAFVEIDKNAGNTATISGSGNVTLNLRPSKAVFELGGEYNINEGNYQFVVPGVISKGFSIQPGSSARFGGDIVNTELDVKATYSLRTSLDALTGLESSSRRQVDCGIHIGDRLRNPSIELTIDVPDLDPSTRSLVESGLSTSDKVQKQFISLLLLGTFLPNEYSGVFNQSNLLLSNLTEVASNQINGILQRMEIPIDVGFGYQQMGSGHNLFDLSLSTQLFNNRVLLSGSIGNRRYSTGNTGGDYMFNLDLATKLDPEGKFRFNIFSHAADEFSNYLDYSQRNGLGASYQRDYATFREFWQSIFLSRKKWKALQQELLGREIEQEIIEIKYEPGETFPDPDPARRRGSRRGRAANRPGNEL